MKLRHGDLKVLCSIATEAAKSAGKFIKESAEKEFSVHTKSGGNSLASQVVTEVDITSQRLILEVLSNTFDQYDLGLLTEESTDNYSRLEKDYFWCIDPLDGTLSFTKKEPGFAVSIALVSKSGTPVIGVVYDPATQTLYHAIKDNGVYKNGISWNPDLEMKDPKTFFFYTDRSFVQNINYASIIEELESFVKVIDCEEIRVVKHAGAVLNACWVLETAPACYFKIPKASPGGGSLWDFAATSCIFHEARAFVSDMNGNTLDLNQKETTFMNKKGVLFASNASIRNKIISLNKIFS